jgi:multiple sugar transport system permease protein
VSEADSVANGRRAARPPARAGSGASSSARAEARFAWLMISPSLLVLVLVSTVPLLVLIGMSFYTIELTQVWKNGFAGLGNYARMFQDDRFWSSLAITGIYTVSTVALQIGIGLALALALSGAFPGRNLLRTLILMPMMLAPVVVGLAWRTLLLTPRYGLIDYLAQALGVGSKSWLGDPQLALGSVIAIHTWQWTPFAFLVFTAALAALPLEPYEAARLDRANAWQMFRYITLPLIRPAIVILIIIRSMIALRAFAAIFAATGGGPGTATEILNLYAYRTSFSSFSLGYGSALATTLLIITVVLSVTFFRVRQGAR